MTSLFDSCQSKIDQSEWRIGVLGMGLAGWVHKNEGGVFIPQSSVKNGDITRKNGEGE